MDKPALPLFHATVEVLRKITFSSMSALFRTSPEIQVLSIGLCLSLVFLSRAENILIFSLIGSHFKLMSILAEELCARGNFVTVVAPTTPFNLPRHLVCFDIVTFDVPEAELQSHLRNAHRNLQNQNPNEIVLPHLGPTVTKALFESSESIYNALRGRYFKVAVVDTCVVGALFIVKRLNLRYIMFSSGRFDIHLARVNDASIPLSAIPFIPHPPGFIRQMTFMERAWNALHILRSSARLRQRRKELKSVRDIYFPEFINTDQDDLLRNATLWIINSDFNIEFPYPVMPNVKYVGSLTVRPPLALPVDLKKYVESRSGVVVVSLSTLPAFPDVRMAVTLQAALKQLGMGVVWRGDKRWCRNTDFKCVEWFPQNDLLGHPQTRALITNGGINGVGEAMYHGVPMVILPLFGDQPENAVRVEARGYGTRLDPAGLTINNTVTALKSVIHNISCREKMKSVSEMLRFQHAQMTGRQLAAYWVEHVSKFAENYVTLPAQNLNYFQLHCLDVVMAFISIVLVILISVKHLFNRFLQSEMSKIVEFLVTKVFHLCSRIVRRFCPTNLRLRIRSTVSRVFRR